MNSKQRRKMRRVMQRTEKKLQHLTSSVASLSEKWNQILVGMGPTGKTNKWEVSSVTIVDK